MISICTKVGVGAIERKCQAWDRDPKYKGSTCLYVRMLAKVSVCSERCCNWIQQYHGRSVLRFVCFWQTLHNGIVKVSEEVSNMEARDSSVRVHVELQYL